MADGYSYLLMTYTLKTLSRRIAPDSSDEAVATAAGRVEHWASSGLFGIAGVDIGPKALGRGRVRRYPEEALPWCLLWAAMADRGLGPVAMLDAVATIRLKLLSKRQDKKWLLEAMRGEGPALFLLQERFGTEPPGTRNYKFKLARAPIPLADNWSGGFLINLTEVYAKAVKG